MRLQQAIVASGVGASPRHQNKVIAWSKGIDSDAAAAICEWSPIRTDFSDGVNKCMAVYSPTSDLTAISRSVLTRPGNRSVVQTRVVLASLEHLAGFEFNPMTIARVLESGGYLCPLTTESTELPEVIIPETGIPDLRAEVPSFLETVPQKINHALDIHGKCVLLGLKQPKAFLCGYFAALPHLHRHKMSAAIGLDISDDREQPTYQLNVLDQTDNSMDQRLARLQIRTIHAV